MAKKHLVKCKYCGETFNTVDIPFVQIGKRYAHESCHQTEEEQKTKAEKDKEALEQYINFLLGTETLSIKVRKQLKDFREINHYTDSGMLKTLQYMYEIKHNNPEKMNGGIGIIGYTYNDAQNYYYKIWLANQKNENNDVSIYKPVVKEIRISKPIRKPYKRKLFTFLDENQEA